MVASILFNQSMFRLYDPAYSTMNRSLCKKTTIGINPKDV